MGATSKALPEGRLCNSPGIIRDGQGTAGSSSFWLVVRCGLGGVVENPDGLEPRLSQTAVAELLPLLRISEAVEAEPKAVPYLFPTLREKSRPTVCN